MAQPQELYTCDLYCSEQEELKRMFGKKINLFKMAGFQVSLDLSWFIIAILLAWTLGGFYFPQVYEGLPEYAYWIMGIAGALGLFASIVLHEFSHSIVAKKNGLPIKGINLFIFGGVAEMEDEPEDPAIEFKMAIAGPAASVVIAVVCFGISALGEQIGWPGSISAVFAYLAWINTILVIFNLVPAFPLDGGRVFRSLLWWWKDNLRWATRITSGTGSGFGIFLIAMGILNFLMGGNVVGGVWLVLIGMFLRGAAQQSYRQLMIREVLHGQPVSQFMESEPKYVSPDTTVEDMIENYVYRYHFKMFPVVDNDQLVGCITTRQVKEVPRDQWAETRIGDILESCSEDNTVDPDEDAMHALAKMNRTGSSRLMVSRDNQLVGIIALKDLMKYLSLKLEIEENVSAKELPA
jgi:Zn-dependent protease